MGQSAATFLKKTFYWWGLFFLLQQTERLFLLPEAASTDPPDAATLIWTLLTGIRADLIVASLGIVLALALSALFWTPSAVLRLVGGRSRQTWGYLRSLSLGCWFIAAFILFAITIDMGYYGYNRVHLDSVFFDYLDDLFSKNTATTPVAQAHDSSSQALKQTQAEIGEAGKWAWRVLEFSLAIGLCVFLWNKLSRRIVDFALANRSRRGAWVGAAVIWAIMFLSLTGFHPHGPWSIARANIPKATYYMLAQNPIWYGSDVYLASVAFKMAGGVSNFETLMPIEEAVRTARATLAPHARYPNDRYPLVRELEVTPPDGVRRPPNVILLFIEGLDRRFLGQSLEVQGRADSSSASSADVYKNGVASRFVQGPGGGGISITPFLDELVRDSVFFKHFFSNGSLTHHGLFSTLCSYYSGYIRSPIKARYTYDYLCLPALLKDAGYWTEMVIGQNRDYHQDHTALFLARNGIQHFLDESNAPPGSERLGLGLTDEALFRFIQQRIISLRQGHQPFFLTSLTLSTHHPYKIPLDDPEVQALGKDPDPYLASLRYMDLQLGLFFRGLERDGLLENTIVLLLGDHGRHENIGGNDMERWVGLHSTPLLIWLDKSLRSSLLYHPRHVSIAASQVDIAPTILGMIGRTPRVTPFWGHDLSCILSIDCVEDNLAVLSSQDVIGVAQGRTIHLYWRHTGQLLESDLDVRGPITTRRTDDPLMADAFRRLKALFVSSAILLDENRVWSWKEFGNKL